MDLLLGDEDKLVDEPHAGVRRKQKPIMHALDVAFDGSTLLGAQEGVRIVLAGRLLRQRGDELAHHVVGGPGDLAALGEGGDGRARRRIHRRLRLVRVFALQYQVAECALADNNWFGQHDGRKPDLDLRVCIRKGKLEKQFHMLQLALDSPRRLALKLQGSFPELKVKLATGSEEGDGRHLGSSRGRVDDFRGGRGGRGLRGCRL
mmetsp:Transcript_38189/g.92119  ORF Transcript_38189/g.92119 Transcript_38189/m.92119 type:complete len:205 (-) Transcript_38189:135-749(-)